MSTVTTAPSTATAHILNPNQEGRSLKTVSNGELLNTNSDPQDKKLEESLITQDPISSAEEEASDVDSPGKPDPDFVPGPQFSLKEQIDLDKDDASLRKWKEQLLGSIDVSSINGAISKEAEVRIVRQIIQSPGRPDIVRTTPYQATSAKSPLFTLKEGTTQQARFELIVSKNIVSGLKYICEVWKRGIRVDSSKKMVGTFGPREEPYTFELEESMIPCGFFVRGTYHCRVRFVDDDGKNHFDSSYYFEIQKNWGSSS